MKWSFGDELTSKLEGAVKKKLMVMQKQIREEMLSLTAGYSEEPSNTASPPAKDLSSPSAVFGNKNLTQMSRVPRGLTQRSPVADQSRMATLQRLTAPPRASTLTQDVMLQQGESPKGIVTEEKKSDGVWEESLRKKHRMKTRLISRAKRRLEE